MSRLWMMPGMTGSPGRVQRRACLRMERRGAPSRRRAGKWIRPRAGAPVHRQNAALTEIVKALRSLAFVTGAPGGAPKMFVLAPLNRLKRNQVA